MKQIGNRVISPTLMYLSFQPKWNENIFFHIYFLAAKTVRVNWETEIQIEVVI